MKHLLNFVPTTKFREGSSFIFRTIRALIYALPIFLFLNMAFEYQEISFLNGTLSDFGEKLEKKLRNIEKDLVGKRPDLSNMNELAQRAITYFSLIKNLNFSWTTLFENLESELPPGVRLVRVRVKPAATPKLIIEGEAKIVTQLTEFLRSLFKSERFSRPRLIRQSALESAASNRIQFNLEVDYLPEMEL